MAIFRWSAGRKRRKQLGLGLLPFLFQLLTLVWVILLVLIPSIFPVRAEQSETFTTNRTNIFPRNNATDDIGGKGSGSWEYYYVDDDDDDSDHSNGNVTRSTSALAATKSEKSSSKNGATGRSGFPNSTLRGHGDEVYYYMEEEEVVHPKDGSGPKVIKTTTLKIDRTHKGKGRYSKGDNIKVASIPYLDIRGSGLSSGLVALPSMEPFRQLATPLEVQGPVYTDYNYGPTYQYGDTAIGEPLGPGEFPSDPYKNVGKPVLLRPPPPASTQPPAESGIELDVVKHVQFIDGVVPVSGSGSYGGGGYSEDEKLTSVVSGDDSKKDDQKNPLAGLLQIPNLRTKFKVEAYGNLEPEKHPLFKAKEFLYHVWNIISHISTSEILNWAEKGFNLVAELTIDQEHYMRVISFVGIYLFVSMMTYGQDEYFELMCKIEHPEIPLKRWRYHASRRFVPARSVDPKMQKRFLKLFRGQKDDDEEEDDEVFDITSRSSASSEEDFSEELDQISDLVSEKTFFYSLNPKHIEAYTILQRVLMTPSSPKKFLKLARRLLHKDKVHPKVWYFAIVGAFLARQDLTGFSIAHPIDAIPDWYIPADLISNLMEHSEKKSRTERSIRSKKSSKAVTKASSKAVASISFSQEDDEASLERLPLKIPVLGDKGNFTVTIVTSKKKKSNSTLVDDNTSSSSNSAAASVPSSEEVSNSIEQSNGKTKAKEEIKLKVEFKPKEATTPKPKPVIKTVTRGGSKEKYVVTKKPLPTEAPKANLNIIIKEANKGDKDDLVVKGKPPKGNGTYNEYVLDNRNHGGRRRSKKKGKKCIKVNWKVGLDNGVENELWYYREDMMLSQHHWYWHQTHPVNSTQHADRRAELFFYMHRSIVARYQSERLSNGLKRVQPLSFQEKHGPMLQQGYNSHLADINSGTFWTPRLAYTPLMDIFHEHDPDFATNITLAYYDTLCRRLVSAIKAGNLLPIHGPPLPIKHSRGIEPLGNTIEAADTSVNPFYYDALGIHSLGHIMIALSADPDFRFKKVTGVMSDAAVSMRDPAFYSYHLFMDNIFELHKERLPPYTVVGGEFPLLWKGVNIDKIELVSQGGPPNNELRTFWSTHKFPLSAGVDRSIKRGKKGRAKICAQHLDHEPFYFKITIDRQPCVKSKSNMGTVRIFMAPRYDEKGKRIPVKIQRRLMFPLDSFTVKLKVGRNTITRYAEDSALTQPWTKHYHDLERGPDTSGAADFCGCGWPQHLYIPKGNAHGMAFDLFVMITNYDIDYVPNDPEALEIPETCNSAHIFCGVPRRKYPDRRPMGYPFDRPLFKSFNCPPGWTFSATICKSLNLVINKPLDTLEEYVSKAPNMALLKFYIRHINEFMPEPARH